MNITINDSKTVYSTIDVPVFNGSDPAGDLRVGIWQPENGQYTKTVLLIHGVTASHRAFDLLPKHLHGVRIVAPDLRGRGRSANVTGPSSMSIHAADIIRVLDAIGIESVPLVGHSMGAFVGLVTAHQFPDRISKLILVDGGMPLEVPEGLTPDQIIQSILGPTAERLAMVFSDVGSYKEFWKQHPGIGPYWDPFMDEYFEYDLKQVEGGYRAATSYAVAKDDTIDLNSGTAITEALQQLNTPTHFVTCPRGLFDQTPGLYSEAKVKELLQFFAAVTHEEIADVNHYTIVMGETGAEAIAKIISELI